MAGYERILFETDGRIALITINRPERMNAIDALTSFELKKAFTDFNDNDDLWVAILTGSGDRAFSAGNDLVAMSELMAGKITLDPEVARAPFGGITRGFECWKPIIAAINGYCLAGGLEIAASCDIRVAAEHAQFGVPEVTRAIIPGASGTQRLPRMLPKGIALELLITGGRFDAEWALRYGLVNHVVPADQVMPKAREIAEAICENGPLAVRAVKESAIRGLDMTFEEGLKQENSFSSKVMKSEDAREGPLAFAQKRKPEYKGR
ncbi:MAG: enoyl-CoA hydratase/isomerase family protein [Chloroflexi bacterium]|nr:enoyl-CoA hydratase/isomerase family protein [Chloroflexota bacterium]